MTNRIWLIRHGKSARPFGVLDQSRPLARRANEDAALIRDWLESGPTLFVPSVARRAVETAELLAADVPIDPRAELYVASASEFLDTIVDTIDGSDDPVRAAFIGHNPTVTTLVNLLAGRTVTDSFPTLGVAMFDYDEERWTLIDYITPKELR